mmetsp:Transcript_130542/g.377642  ORF Transcript_130542/g.377642 Transcript_130542/m.377642 type:complete len:206 (+) Transcript_130542:1798-2415(+)
MELIQRCRLRGHGRLCRAEPGVAHPTRRELRNGFRHLWRGRCCPPAFLVSGAVGPRQDFEGVGHFHEQVRLQNSLDLGRRLGHPHEAQGVDHAAQPAGSLRIALDLAPRLPGAHRAAGLRYRGLLPRRGSAGWRAGVLVHESRREVRLAALAAVSPNHVADALQGDGLLRLDRRGSLREGRLLGQVGPDALAALLQGLHRCLGSA